jgi:hypothetical protein
MKRSRWSLIFLLGLTATGNASAVAQTTTAGSADKNLTVIIHVYNSAEVDHKTLMEAEKVATEIFRKVGAESRWLDVALTSESKQENSADQESFNLSHIRVNIYPRLMDERLGLSNKVLGLAPGTGPDRQVIYVFYDRVEALAHSQVRAVFEGSIRRPATTGQILGHAIAHEIGHLLLNLESHSATGIMRGDWNLNDLQSVASGFLLFTPQQAEVIRAEVARRVGLRRVGQLQAVGLAGLSRCFWHAEVK